MFRNLSGLRKAAFLVFMLWMTVSLTGCAFSLMGIISSIMGVVGQVTSLFTGGQSSEQPSQSSGQDSSSTSQEAISSTNTSSSVSRTTTSGLPQLNRSRVLDNENPLTDTSTAVGIQRSSFASDKNLSGDSSSSLGARQGGLFSRSSANADSGTQNNETVRELGNNVILKKNSNNLWDRYGKTKDGQLIPLKDGEFGTKDGYFFPAKTAVGETRKKSGASSDSGVTDTQSGVSNEGNSNSQIILR